MTTPVKNDRGAARSQFREDVDIVATNPLASRQGWRLRPDYENLRLYADMWALDENRRRLDGDDYHVLMDMEYYRNYPPGVTFVNPETWSFDPASDMRWFPRWGPSRPQLVTLCCDPKAGLKDKGYDTTQVFNNTMFLEYYFNGADISAHGAWDPKRNTFFGTLHILQNLLTKPHYEGRMQ